MNRQNSGQTANYRCQLAYLPVFFTIWQTCGWILTYSVSLASGNIDPVLPFISHTGVNLPEAAPFTLVHSISAVCAALIIYIRFRQVQLFQPVCQKHSRWLWKINVVSLVLGEFASLGLFFVAYFPQDGRHRVVYWVHICAAMVNFSTGVTYQMLQAVITRLMHPEVISIRYFWYRFAIAAIGLAGFFICLTSGIIITQQKVQISTEANVTAAKGWGRSNKDWTTSATKPYLQSFAVGEWMIGAGFVLFFSSFYNDFLHLRFNCSVDNNITITQRLPVGLGMASSNNSNGTTCATRYLYQPDSNSATSSGNINHSSSMNNYLNNYTDIVTTSNTSIN